jgi:hypothetical protein
MKGHCPHMGSGSHSGSSDTRSVPGQSGAGYPGAGPEVTYQ